MKNRKEKHYLVSGYAVNARGYTCGAKANVSAFSRDEAVIRAAAQLRWSGLSQFKALSITEITRSV